MEVAAGVVGIASFAFQTFQGCVQAFQFVERAQLIGYDGEVFRTGLLWERYRLMQWGQRAGLLEKGTPDASLNWDFAKIFLEQIDGLLTSADALKKRYGLDVSVEEIEEEQSRDLQPPEKGIPAFIAKLRPEIHTAAGKVIQSRNGPMKRVRWAALGKSDAERLVKDIAQLNDRLVMLLDSADRERRKAEDEKLLRGLVSLTTTAMQVSQLETVLPVVTEKKKTAAAIAAAAHLKQVRLLLGTDKRADEIRTQPSVQAREAARMPVVKAMKRTLRPYHGQELTYTGLEFAVHGVQPVIIQWKASNSSDKQEWTKHEQQIKLLVALLSAMEDPSFRSLPCLGHYPAPNQTCYGIVYAAPDDKHAWQLTSLYDIIPAVQDVSLAKRLEIAKAVAETILQLHTAGWLHKSLKSESVVFFADKEVSAGKAIQSDPFVFGYDYARPDSTEGAVYTQWSEANLAGDLYRHPNAQGHDRETYQKRFDMYALGCIFVELLFWKRLVDIHAEWTCPGLMATMEVAQKTNTMPEGWKLPSMMELLENGAAVARMTHLAGEKYIKAVRTCVFIDKAEEGQEASLEEEIEVVETLGSCRV
ncbi:hypothetical protein DL764_009003 [Monosporascus ibericus]|uniref:Prion-inhibition and propagation HeLo domain-containing protein n=1 Tax=Monosporascus ibericus TaxID=155417 RepID=A0A4Q4SW18_9PEZI|nr:hypothetical protein DL764_009003 [Monosporascus ibericus]